MKNILISKTFQIYRSGKKVQDLNTKSTQTLTQHLKYSLIMASTTKMAVSFIFYFAYIISLYANRTHFDPVWNLFFNMYKCLYTLDHKNRRTVYSIRRNGAVHRKGRFYLFRTYTYISFANHVLS